MSIKAWLTRLFAALFGLFTRREGRPATARRERLEPRLDGRSPALAPSAHDDDEEEYEEEDEEEEEEPAPRAKKAKPASRGREKFELPPVSVLAAPRASDRHTPSPDLIEQNAKSLEGVLQDFGVRGEIVNARPGPVVTLYELEPAPGIKSSRVIGLADDIARSMSAVSARVAVVAGRNAIGIELPNEFREKVYLRELLSARDYSDSVAKLPLCARQDHRRRVGDRRPDAHAASVDRRHHRLGQIGRHQHHDPVAGVPAHAGAMPPDHDRSEDARTLRL